MVKNKDLHRKTPLRKKATLSLDYFLIETNVPQFSIFGKNIPNVFVIIADNLKTRLFMNKMP